MKEFVICKSCGFIMDKSKVRDVCPACGVPAKMFEPYKEKLSPYRKLILSLDLHPVLVHFPQAFIFTILAMSIMILFIKGDFQKSLFTTLSILSFCLPFSVVFAFLAGMLDGKIRFRKVTTPLLVQKIVLGSLFFVFSIVIWMLCTFCGLEKFSVQLILVGFAVLAEACSAILAILGVSVMNAKFPG